MNMQETPILEVNGLKTHFFTKQGIVKAVDGVDLTVRRGEIMGLVGESGSGKSVSGFSIMGLIDDPGKVVAGKILLNGRDIVHCSEKEYMAIRGKSIAMIFQDPMMTLNPVLRIDTQMIEALHAHQNMSRSAALTRCREALISVGISSPDERLKAYPHQFSGGMRQRVAIAIALLNEPELIIADEPTTALDVTIQGQILHEVQKLCRQKGTALIWITHDLTVVAGLADTLSVMYAGKVVEYGQLDTVLDHPCHPYTRGLIGSVPSHTNRGKKLYQIPGMAPSLLDLPLGCAFKPRCFKAAKTCDTIPYPITGNDGHVVCCHHPVERES